MEKRALYLTSLILVLGSRLANGEAAGNLRAEASSIEHIRSVVKSTNLRDVSYIFGKSKKVAVALGTSGSPRILVGDVSDELINTKIRGVVLKPIERYNAREAIATIVQAEEVRINLSTLKIERPLTALGGVMQEPIPRLPHLPAVMKNVTLGEALDKVAHIFSGVIIYGEWRDADGTRLFDVDFAATEKLLLKK